MLHPPPLCGRGRQCKRPLLGGNGVKHGEMAFDIISGIMGLEVRAYADEDIPQMRDIWNEVVRAGIAFPQEEELSLDEARAFFAKQSKSAVAVEDGAVAGLYILHPNNVGRCGHIANASYAVSAKAQGRVIGEALVRDSLASAKELGFRIMQFNAVVASNAGARHLYEKISFKQLGVIEGGFRMPDGTFADICPYFISL